MDVGVITSGRPFALKRLIDSLFKYNKYDFNQLYIYNTTPCNHKEINNQYENLCDSEKIIYKSIDGVGPSYGRNQLLQDFNSDTILVLDDDLYINNENAIKNLKKYKSYFGNNTIVGGLWHDEDNKRPISYTITKENNILYQFNNYSTDNSEFIQTDKAFASFIIDKNTILNVNFDINFHFYGEMLDFFLSCKEKNIKIYNILNSVFIHNHININLNYNNEKRNFRNNDFNYLKNKWNINKIYNNVKV